MDNQVVFEKYRKRKRLKNILIICMVLLLIFGKLAANDLDQVPALIGNMLPAGIIIITILFVVLLMFIWRCPQCNSYLGREMSLNYCPKCGVKLEDF